MRTNNLIPFFWAIILHAAPIGYFALKKSGLNPTEPIPRSYELSAFSLEKKKTQAPAKATFTSQGPSPTAHSNSITDQVQTGEQSTGGLTSAAIEFIKMEQPPYPPAARASGLEGKVKINGTYNSSGNVEEVVISESSGSKVLDESVKKTVLGWKLKTTKSGYFTKIFEFKLNN
jgi:TonB family protein